MSLQKCPKCNKNSLSKRPEGRIMKDYFGSLVCVGSQYKNICLDKECGYEGDIYQENTNFSDKLKNPWYKRLFN